MSPDCRHEESLYGRCVACGMTWEAQEVERASHEERTPLTLAVDRAIETKGPHWVIGVLRSSVQLAQTPEWVTDFLNTNA